MIKKRDRSYLTDRDREILMFLYRFKVATTAMLYHKFFSDIRPRTAFNILQRIRRLQFIAVRTDEYGKNPLWTLEEKGFRVVRYDLPELKANGFKSEYKEHDLIVGSIHLGEFLKEVPEDIELVTEQELRNYLIEFLPRFTPDPNGHRPDGYWIFENGKNIKLMALEVEISRKSKQRYQWYSCFYKQLPDNYRALWVVKTKSQILNILRGMYKYKPEYKIHNFILLKDFYKKGWDAKILAGPERGKTILNLFCENSEYIDGNSSVKDFQKYLLDRRLGYEIHSKNSILENSKSGDYTPLLSKKPDLDENRSSESIKITPLILNKNNGGYL